MDAGWVLLILVVVADVFVGCAGGSVLVVVCVRLRGGLVWVLVAG